MDTDVILLFDRMTKKIVFCTLRNNRGATGGPGGVLYMLKILIGNTLDGISCIYRFNTINRSGFVYWLLNHFIFALKGIFEKDTYYVTHDIQAACILAFLRKDYILVYHNQGPIIYERMNFGKVFSPFALTCWKIIERKAFLNAKSLHFPSNGAAEMYFSNEYATCKQDEVYLAQPLFNTIPHSVSKPIEGLKLQAGVITFYSVGALTEAKGQDLSIGFINNFLRHCGGCLVRYIVIGKGPLENSVCEVGNKLMEEYSNFQFVHYQFLPHSQVMYVHEISDVYLMLHRLSIFDFATLEAMASGSALVLSSVGGNMDFQKKNNVILYDDCIHTIENILNSDINALKRLNKEVFDEYFSNEAFRRMYFYLIHNTIRKR